MYTDSITVFDPPDRAHLVAAEPGVLMTELLPGLCLRYRQTELLHPAVDVAGRERITVTDGRRLRLLRCTCNDAAKPLKRPAVRKFLLLCSPRLDVDCLFSS